MGMTASRESGKGSVKIKRVGGHAQKVHRPISVQEVMLRNPKHWVTKPDLFESLNPVVKVVPPEAVLRQGQTILLVPFKTMQALLERQQMCPAALDTLMDRPGLAIREWYQQNRERTAVACPVKNCKCSCVKKNSCKYTEALSTQSSLREVGALPNPTHEVGNAPELDVKPCTRLKKTNLKCPKHHKVEEARMLCLCTND